MLLISIKIYDLHEILQYDITLCNLFYSIKKKGVKLNIE